eukprot:TRINITY_DN8927_c0_g1_i1.p2 TRINITY_DN8927_c0_g1~~TRINITY_DN8927_c0_g1_i1.p2  ORF type:complete len:111 (+),score=3.14 TRINITY_DN8927_c0_g1_i1:144-476(+)
MSNILLVVLVAFTLCFGQEEEMFSGNQRSSTVCEGSDLNLYCPSGSVLDITYAQYGRTNRNTCPYTAGCSNPSCSRGCDAMCNTNCQRNVLSSVSSRCEGNMLRSTYSKH